MGGLKIAYNLIIVDSNIAILSGTLMLLLTFTDFRNAVLP